MLASSAGLSDIRVRMKEWKIALLILIWPVLLLGGALFMYKKASQPRVEVRNFSGTDIAEFTVDYAPSLANGQGAVKAALGEIRRGASAEFRFPKGEYFVNVSFTQAGRARQLECGIIGEENAGMFLVSLQPDPQKSGCVKLSVLESPN